MVIMPKAQMNDPDLVICWQSEGNHNVSYIRCGNYAYLFIFYLV